MLVNKQQSLVSKTDFFCSQRYGLIFSELIVNYEWNFIAHIILHLSLFAYCFIAMAELNRFDVSLLKRTRPVISVRRLPERIVIESLLTMIK